MPFSVGAERLVLDLQAQYLLGVWLNAPMGMPLTTKLPLTSLGYKATSNFAELKVK